jgi:hypothetical protein
VVTFQLVLGLRFLVFETDLPVTERWFFGKRQRPKTQDPRAKSN